MENRSLGLTGVLFKKSLLCGTLDIGTQLHHGWGGRGKMVKRRPHWRNPVRKAPYLCMEGGKNCSGLKWSVGAIETTRSESGKKGEGFSKRWREQVP